MQAIKTRFFGPGHHHGAKVQAICATGYVKIDYDHGKDEQSNHEAACKALLTKLGWTPERGYNGSWAGGEHAGDWYWVFCKEASHVQAAR